MKVDSSSLSFLTKFMIVGGVVVFVASLATSFEVSFPPVGGGGGVNTFTKYGGSGVSNTRSGSDSRRKTRFQRRQFPQEQASFVSPLQSRVTYLQQYQQYQENFHSSLSCSGRITSTCLIFPRLSSYRPNASMKKRLSSTIPPSSLSSTPEGSEDKNDEEEEHQELGVSSSGMGDEKKEVGKSSKNVGYDDLYEFLTRRTGKQAGESERKGKRDRIMQWMGSSNSDVINDGNSGSGSASNLIQPIRLEDGKVDEELLAKQQKQEQQSKSSRTKVKFDQLFSGMPSLDEIISRDNANSDDGGGATDNNKNSNKSKITDIDDFSWFEPERLRIEREYDQIRQETKERIYEQRLLEESEGNVISDSSSSSNIPENAEGIADAIVQQEMNRMVESVKLKRAKERLQEYTSNRSSDIQSRDYRDASNDVVNNILKETAEKQERNEKLKARADKYRDYEQSLLRQQQQKASDNGDGYNQEIIPGEDTDIDTWTLERLEVMLQNSQQREDDDGTITDILEENIENLRKYIEQESKKGSIEPQTMKEWQMFRSIATKLAKGQQQNRGETMNNDEYDDNNVDVDEAQVVQQLNSWREFVKKEDVMRQRSGLSSSPKLPFDHLGAKPDQILEESSSYEDADEENGNKSHRELSREINIQAVQAMEGLIQKSDNIRAENLKKQLKILKADLESRDYNDFEEEIIEESVPVEPVDLSDVFNQKEKEEKKISITSDFSNEEIAGINQVLSDSYTPPSLVYEDPVQRDPPESPFVSDSPKIRYQPPAPNTPFFQESNESDVEELDTENKLGSVDEQKLQAMFRRANARTNTEQDVIRQEWEAFQAFEKESRDRSGLSENPGDSTLTDNVKLKYDVNDVMTNDGDFDADKILSTIGPRPVRKKSQGSNTAGDTTIPIADAKTDVGNEALRSDVDPSEVADAIYRSVAAAGGGRGIKDEALREKDRAEYEDYLAKEEQMRRNLDQIQEETFEASLSEDVDIDDPKYAEGALGPRPVVKRKYMKVLDERELSDRGGIRVTKEEDDDEVDDSSTNNGSVVAIDESAFDDIVPAWLKKEREAAAKSREEGSGGLLGSDIDEVFDDDKYEKNLRQLHEYEQRRSGRKQMGIDVSDIFGRRGSDDYVDFTYDSDYLRDRQDEWGEKSLQARKANLLEYIELDSSEVNNLIAHKDSTYSSGVSQYLPRINKPFKEFGAIFRLEGVLVDITGLQQKVWNRVAIEFDFKEPLIEDIKRVSVLGPDSAVRELFHSTIDDFVLIRRIVDAYRRILVEEFDIWANEQGIDTSVNIEPSINDNINTTPEKGSLVIGSIEGEATIIKQGTQPTVSPLDEGNRLRQLKEIWSKTAKQFGFSPPTNEQIAESSMLSPDIAVRIVFCWSEDQAQIEKIASAYSIVQGGGVSNIREDPNPPRSTISTTDNEPSREPQELTEEIVLELQYMAWEKVAEENSLEIPNPEEVLAAAVLNNPEVVVVDGFGWTENPIRATELASRYRDCLTKLVNDLIHKRSYTPIETKPIETKENPVTDTATVKPMIPSKDDILSSQLEAWKEAAREHDFDIPPSDQIQLVMNLNPQDSVRQLILMDFDIDTLSPDEATEFVLTIEEITETYISALERSSKKYLKKYKSSSDLDLQVSSDSVSDTDTLSKSKVVSQDEIYSAAFDAWTSVAWKLGFPLPVQQEILFAFTVGPLEAIINGFCWVEDEAEAKDIAQQYLDQIKLRRDSWLEKGYTTTVEIESSNHEKDSIPLVKVMPDVTNWIKSLRAVEMGCGVVTHLEDDQMKVLIEFAGLSELLPSDDRVSHSNGYLRESQQLLGVSLRIERRPDHCVIFDTSPFASVAANEFGMRSVAMVGPYPRYELMAADTSATSVDEFTAMNIRRLFGERVYDQPELDIELDMKDRKPENNRPVKTKYKWAGDE